MSRGFSEREKELITRSLLQFGKDFFSRYGLKKTRIKDLTDKVGIAQGSFYSFFDSKEELYFAIIEDEEKRIRQEFLQFSPDKHLTVPDFVNFLLATFQKLQDNTFFQQLLKGEDYQLILRKLPESKIENHINNDQDFLLPIINKWQEEGQLIEERPEVIVGLFRGLFTMALHKKEIGEEIFDDVLYLLLKLVGKGLLGRGEDND